jgi:alkylation response protein AidB-like acyl-CoA dehydrogenase
MEAARANGTQGTDHGTANSHFVLGGRVAGGFYGQAPLLAGISEGLHTVAIAWQEHRYDRTPKTTSCRKAGAGWHLSGTKRHVLDAPDAAYTLITAVDGDGAVRLFCVETATLEATREQRMDGRPAATLTFALELPATAEVTFYEGAELAWSQACDVAAIAVSAQMVGAAQAALDMRAESLKEEIEASRAQIAALCSCPTRCRGTPCARRWRSNAAC